MEVIGTALFVVLASALIGWFAPPRSLPPLGRLLVAVFAGSIMLPVGSRWGVDLDAGSERFVLAGIVFAGFFIIARYIARTQGRRSSAA
jgi:hypothetical protein